MLTLLSAALMLAAAAPPSTAAADPCAGRENCRQLSAAQLFAAADDLAEQGDLAGAAQLLEVLTQDPHPELRAEARFRLAAAREKLGDLKGAAAALRELLAEQPGANPARLELARILSRLGDSKAAKAELAAAEAWGLPPDVEQNVRRFASTLRTSTRKRGLTVELTAGPDSNVNRSTSSLFIDTIIAPFELDADARRQSALGFTGSLRGYSRDRIGGITLLSDAGLRADLSTKPRFNDIQFVADSGPEIAAGKARLRPAFLYERRWFGGDPFSTGIGGQAELLAPLGSRAQLSLSGSYVHQKVAKNSGQDGWRIALNADFTRAIGTATSARLSLRYAALDARVSPESLRQIGGGVLLTHQSRPLTLFGEVDYTCTHGIEPIFLFGNTRRDHRWDLIGGAIFNRASIAGFTPLVRVTHSDSRANIVLYDYRRTRFDFGVTRSF
jgi:tetratricopeptide (TPR) repeat protein